MNYFIYLIRFLFRIRWWLLIGTIITALAAIYFTRNMRGGYDVEATLYTGVVSGYSIEGSNSVDWQATQNAMDNLINIIQAESTLKHVSLRLFARIMINGELNKDNNNVTSSSFQYTYNHVKNSKHGKEILALIDKSSEDKTVENLMKYEQPNKDNYIYGLFYYQHPYYSYEALKKIKVVRMASSDLLNVSYISGDPGIAYYTIDILMKEFVNEYRSIRYGETDKVIDYFRGELTRIGTELNGHEDELTQYNVDKRIINYYDETKEVAAINKEFELRYQDVLFAFNSSKAMVEELERRMDTNTKQAISSMQLIDKLRQASELTGKITEMETISSGEVDSGAKLKSYKDQLVEAREQLSTLSNSYVGGQYTKEGLTKQTIVNQWLDQTLLYEKAKAELRIVQQHQQELNDKYAFFAPVGTTIKRKERTINFTEQNYLSVLKSYNEALMRKKNLEMTSATLKVLNMPAYPINEEATNRKKLVMGATAGGFIFILALLLVVEMVDRTLRDSIRAKKLTGCKVLGAFPGHATLKNRKYDRIRTERAVQYMSSTICRFFTQKKENRPYIVNFLSTDKGSGKSYLSAQLEEYWSGIGLKVRKLTAGVDFDSNSRQYILAQSVLDLYTHGNEDILIVEHLDMHQSNIPSDLLHEANLNLIIAPANRGWKETDKVLLEKLKTQIGKGPYYIYLNFTDRYVVEDYTGMLPPYTFKRKFIYRLSQMALTEKPYQQQNVSATTKSRDKEEDDE